MLKFFAKLIFVLMGFFLLFQMPYFKSYTESIRISINEKVDNVMQEVNRIRGKVDNTVEKVVETKEKVDNFTDKVGETKDNVEDTIKSAHKAINSIDDALTDAKNGEEDEEGEAESDSPAIPTETTPSEE